METIFQIHWFSTVKAFHTEELLVETSFLSTDIEAAARMVINRKTFLIQKATWEICRSPGGELNANEEVPGLTGVEAYFGAGDAIRQAVEGYTPDLPQEMLSECIRSIIQAESILYLERGFPSLEAYEKYWEDFYNNSGGQYSNLYRSCRYYSSLHRVIRKWAELMKSYTHNRNFYNLHKSIILRRLPGGNLHTTGTFCDSFHEMEVFITLDSNTRQVLSARGNFLRAPNDICFETAAMITGLKGLSLDDPGKKAIGEITGGMEGCSHLVDLVYDISMAIKSGLK